MEFHLLQKTQLYAIMCIRLGNLLKKLYFTYCNSMHSTTHYLYDNILQGYCKSLKHRDKLGIQGLSNIYLAQEF